MNHYALSQFLTRLIIRPTGSVVFIIVNILKKFQKNKKNLARLNFV